MKISTCKLSFMSSKLLVLLLSVFVSVSSFAQTIPTPATGDYESAGSGAWNSAATWTIVGGGTVPASGPSFGHNVHIKSGHTVNLVAAASCRNLYVNTGGILVNGNATYNILTIGRTLAAATTESFLINNGTIGTGNGVDVAIADADKLDVQVNNTYASGFPAVSTFTFAGNGNTKISGLSAIGAGGTATKTMTLNISHDASKTLVLAGATNPQRTLTVNRLNSNSVNEYYIMNINSPIAVSTGSFAINTSGSTGLSGGSYTYNINSTLDVSRGTATQGFVGLPSSNNTNLASGLVNTTILNVKGTYILGSGGFTTHNSTAGTNFSKVEINILDGGLVDASKVPNIGFGSTTLALTGAYFNISGDNRTGKLKRTLASGSNDYIFPIGTPAGYSPIIIRNTGTTGDFTVGVVDNYTGFNTFTSPISSATVLKNRFTVLASNAGSVISLLKFGWQANDEGSSFDRTQALSLQKYGTTEWNADANVTTSAITGTGTAATSLNQNSTAVAADPYLVTLIPTVGPPAGVIALSGNYTISQNPSVLPLTLLSFTGKLNDFTKEVELKWTTTSEVNTKNFEVLESVDGKTFTVVGTIGAKNTAGIHNYGFTLKSNKNGVLYYKIKQLDNDGKFQFSNNIAVEVKGELLSVFPNPAQSYIVVNIPQVSGLGNLSIYSQDGKIVYSKAIAENETSCNVNIEGFNSGVYFLIINKGKELSSQKFVKQ